MSSDRSTKRLRAVLDALARHQGRGWTVREDDAVPALGLGRSDGFRRVAAFCERHPPMGPRSVIRRGVVVWRQAETYSNWYSDGEHTVIRWKWEVDDGDGWIADGEASSLPKAVAQLWPDVWKATAEPSDLIAARLRQDGPDEMGEPKVSAGRLTWGLTLADGTPADAWLVPHLHPIQIIVDPDGHAADSEGWPAVLHGQRKRLVRAALPPAELAARLAAIALDLAEKGLESSETPALRAATRPAYFLSAPEVPPRVAAAASTIGAMVDDWKARLREAFAGETERRFKSREKRIAERAELGLHLPGSDFDEYGRERSRWSGQPKGSARLAVPVDLLGALWALGLTLRELSVVTTGRPSSRNTINERLRELRDGADGWTKKTTGAQLVRQHDLGWARALAGGGAPGGTSARARAGKKAKKRPTADAGAEGRTFRVTRRDRPTEAAAAEPGTIRVRRRGPAPLVDVLGDDPSVASGDAEAAAYLDGLSGLLARIRAEGRRGSAVRQPEKTTDEAVSFPDDPRFFLGRCRKKHRSRLKGRLAKAGYRWRVEIGDAVIDSAHSVSELYLPCPRCTTDDQMQWNNLVRFKLLKATVDANVACCAQCRRAYGDECTCSCGGLNHGIDHDIEAAPSTVKPRSWDGVGADPHDTRTIDVEDLIAAGSATGVRAGPPGVATFVDSLPDGSRRFLELLHERETLSISELLDATDSSRDRSGIKRAQSWVSSIGRWAPIRGFEPPYEASMLDGERVWFWTGWRLRTA